MQGYRKRAAILALPGAILMTVTLWQAPAVTASTYEPNSVASSPGRQECRTRPAPANDGGFTKVGGVEVPTPVAWAWEERVDQAINAVSALVSTHPETVLGVLQDHERRRLILRYSPDTTASKLSQLRQETAQASAGTVAVVLEPACYSRSDIEEARVVVESRSWVTSNEPAAASWFYRAEDGRLVVELGQSLESDGDRLQATLGNVVDVVIQADGSNGRASCNGWSTDLRCAGMPAYTWELGNCTTGFTIAKGTRNYGSAAGHCVSGLNKTLSTTSGSYGSSVLRYDPDPDFALFSGASYGAYIDTEDPDGWGADDAYYRRVTSKVRTGAVNFCLAGKSSGTYCGVEAEASNATYCDDFLKSWTCTYHLYRVRSIYGHTIVGPGDSGGPGYGRTGSSDASARGMIVAYASSGKLGYLHNIGTVENASGGSILTHPY